MQSETRTLKCTLTPAERDAKADEAGRRLRDLESAQLVIDTKTRELKSAKETASSIQASLNGLIDVRDRGWENRQVECHWRPDRARQILQLIRSDTGDVIETREAPRQQTIAGVTESAPRATASPALAGVEVGLYGEEPDGEHYRVQAVSPDSVVIARPDGSTRRVSAADWSRYAPEPDIDQQEYVDAYEAERAPVDADDADDADDDADEPSEIIPRERSDDGLLVLRALDREGKTSDEVAAETGLARASVKAMCGLFVARGLVVEGSRDTGKRGRKPTTYAIADAGEAVAAESDSG